MYLQIVHRVLGRINKSPEVTESSLALPIFAYVGSGSSNFVSSLWHLSRTTGQKSSLLEAWVSFLETHLVRLPSAHLSTHGLWEP